ncbi:MAG: hypothetical protein IPK67_19565 [Planctomycetes bacterium]|nr:hypothetical protein [Planctomycetota bacterium]
MVAILAGVTEVRPVDGQTSIPLRPRYPGLLLTLLLPLTLLAPAYAERALFLGNSFTFDGELDQTTLALLEEGAPSWVDGEAARLAEGGLTLASHLSKVETAGTGWAAALADEG